MIDIKQPTIIMQFKCQESLQMMPDLYVCSFEDAIKANANDYETLEAIRLNLISLRAEVDNLQGILWARSHNNNIKLRGQDEE